MSIARDLRFAFTLLVRDRTFSLISLLTLAVVIGANAAIFSVVNAVLLRPLPYPEADRLVAVYNLYPGVGVTQRGANAVPDYFDRRAEPDLFAELAMLDNDSFNIGEEGAPERVRGMSVTATLFSTLGVPPRLGRPFTAEDEQVGNEQVVILGYDLWRQRFAGDDGALQQNLRINGKPYRVVGVMPEGFRILDREVQLLVPLAFTDEQKSDDARHSNNYAMIGRLADGVTVELARQRIEALNQRNLERFPQYRTVLENAGFYTAVEPAQDYLVRETRPKLYLVQAGVLFVLLIGCVNIANLNLVRSNRRIRELGVRLALGAGRWRIARQLMVESLLLAALGGILGLALAVAGVEALTRFGLDQLPRGSEVSVDGTVLAFTALAALGTGLLVGLVPLVHVLRSNLAQVFRAGGRAGSSGRRATVTRSLLVVLQLTLACVLLISASLMIVSFQRVLAVDPGFEPQGVLSALLTLPESRYGEEGAVSGFFGRALDGIGTLPGVEGVAIASLVPMSGNLNASVIAVEGYELAPGENPPVPHFNFTTGGYFDVLGIPLLAGRTFDDRDSADAPLVAMVDHQLAERYWPGGDAVGRRLRRGLADPEENPEDVQWLTVVGVVGNVRTFDLADPDRVGTVYFPLTQSPRRGLGLLVKSTRQPEALTASVRQEVLRLDPELPLFDVKTMDERLAESVADRRTPMLLLLIFAGVALGLSAVGIYGVLAYSVTLRRREIGIRSALGAEPGKVLRLVMWQGARLIAFGLALGLVLAVVASRVIKSQLYGVAPNDPAVFVLVAAVLGSIALVACLGPSLRATRVDPVVALRSD